MIGPPAKLEVIVNLRNFGKMNS